MKFLGHRIHPMPVAYPIALLSVGVLFDALYFATGTDDLARFAFQAPADASHRAAQRTNRVT